MIFGQHRPGICVSELVLIETFELKARKWVFFAIVSALELVIVGDALKSD